MKCENHVCKPFGHTNWTSYAQICQEVEDRSHISDSTWTEPDYDVSCKKRSELPVMKEVLFLNTTTIRLDWTYPPKSPDCTFSYFRVRYQVR